MANRPRGFGMTAELAKKKAAKFDADLANEVFAWIVEILESSNTHQDLINTLGTVSTDKDVHIPLKSGVVLCQLMNAICPNTIRKINTGNMAFKQMENIANFLTACEGIGCTKADLFQTVDLFECNNISQVINGIFALGRKASSKFDVPRLGPEEATENKRTFTEDQLRAGEGVIGLQAGSNKGATQAGQNFGKTRAIID